MTKAEQIKSLFSEIDSVKAGLRQQVEAIRADASRSQDWKQAQAGEAEDAARRRLEGIAMKAEKALPEWEKVIQQADRFDYADPNLRAAIELIHSSGADLPAEVCRQIGQDFQAQQGALAYMVTKLSNAGNSGGAMALDEARQGRTVSPDLVRRVSDAVYYACLDVNGSDAAGGLAPELDALDNFEQALAAGGAAE